MGVVNDVMIHDFMCSSHLGGHLAIVLVDRLASVVQIKMVLCTMVGCGDRDKNKGQISNAF